MCVLWQGLRWRRRRGRCMFHNLIDQVVFHVFLPIQVFFPENRYLLLETECQKQQKKFITARGLAPPPSHLILPFTFISTVTVTIFWFSIFLCSSFAFKMKRMSACVLAGCVCVGSNVHPRGGETGLLWTNMRSNLHTYNLKPPSPSWNLDKIGDKMIIFVEVVREKGIEKTFHFFAALNSPVRKE